MPDRTNIVYRYDGTFDGFLCCVFESFRMKESPADIESLSAMQETLFPTKYIDTVPKQALRVKKSIPLKMSPEANRMIQNAFLTCMEQKELKILRFMQLGYRVGKKVVEFTTHPDVHEIIRGVRFLGNEAHYSTEFLRFSGYGDFLAAKITPKNNVLPLMVGHFCDRFPDENFVIYDANHKTAFMHQNDGQTKFIYDAQITFPKAEEEEKQYRALWKHFYQTIAVEGRINPKLRRNMMPKRYWPNMTEFQEEETASSRPPAGLFLKD